jgi:hypothetical protein
LKNWPIDEHVSTKVNAVRLAYISAITIVITTLDVWKVSRCG